MSDSSTTVVDSVRLTSRDQFEPWVDRWDTLARASFGLFFRSSSWLLAWWDTFAPENTIDLLVAGGHEAPTGMLALTTLRQPLHPRLAVGPRCVVLAGSGLGAADHCGPNALDREVAERLLVAAARMSGRQPFLVDQLDRSHQLAVTRLGTTTEQGYDRCPRIDLGSIDHVDQLWSPKLRKELRRRRRRLQEEGFVGTWRQLGNGDEARLLPLQRLHQSLWQSRGREGLFAAQRMKFLVRIAELSTGDEGPWLYTVSAEEGHVIGALLGFGFGRTFCSYKTGWDPAHHHLGLGVLMHAAAIERAKERDVTTYDFLRGTEAHKYRLGGVDRVDRSYIVGSSALTLMMRQRARLIEWRDGRAASA